MNQLILSPIGNLLEMALLFASFYLPGMLIQARDLDRATESPGRFMAQALLSALPQLALFLYVLWLRERRDATQLGTSPNRGDLRSGASPWQRFGLGRLRLADLAGGALVFAGALGLLLLVSLALRLLPASGRELLREGFRFRLGDWRLVPLALAFGVVTGYREELFFRGYLITRFTDMGVPGAAAVAASCLLFALGHLYQGLAGFLTALCLGILFGALFLRSRALHPLAIAHALYNTVVLAATLWLPSAGPAAG